MKGGKITLYLNQYYKPELLSGFAKAQERCASLLTMDIRSRAPVDSGTYKTTIKQGMTMIKDDEITTRVYTDYMVGNYNLGMLLEYGTRPHAIPNAFGWGDIFGYDSPQYKRTLQPDWHPGFLPIPHFKPGLEDIKPFYIKSLREVITGKWTI